MKAELVTPGIGKNKKKKGVSPMHTVTRKIQNKFIAAALKGTLSACPKCDKVEHKRKPKRGTWCAMFDKFARFLFDHAGIVFTLNQLGC